MASSDSSGEIESLPAEDEEASTSITEETFDEELPVLEEKQKSSLLAEPEAQEESQSSQETTTTGGRYESASSSSLEFSSQPSVRQSMLLTRKEAMLQQARRSVDHGRDGLFFVVMFL